MPSATELERAVIDAAIEWRRCVTQGTGECETAASDYVEAATVLQAAVDALIADRKAFAAKCEEKINNVFDSIPGLVRVT